MSQPPAILIVEDDPAIAELVAVILRDAGYRVRSAPTATDALIEVDAGDLDLLVLDWMLPDVQGVQVCRTVKERTAGSFLPILMLTARGEPADRVAGLDAGADDYLTKPFNIEELLARVRALLRIRAAEAERNAAMQALETRNAELLQAYDQLSTAQARLVQSSKLAALGELVAGVAHELNNPLAIILGNAELLPMLDDPADRRAVEQIIGGAKRARRVLQSLVTFARRGSIEKEWTAPTDLVERVLDLKLAALRGAGVRLDLSLDPDLPAIWIDVPQIQQVLLNLLMNAEQALFGRPEPRVVMRLTRGADTPPPILPATAAAEPGQFVRIDVADNGVGIPEDVVARLFQPFVTTRPVGQGSGLGLAIAYGIVTQHNGSLLVASMPDRGTTVRVALPAPP